VVEAGAAWYVAFEYELAVEVIKVDVVFVVA